MAHNEPHMALYEPGLASGTDEPRVARSEPCVAQVFLQCGTKEEVKQGKEKMGASPQILRKDSCSFQRKWSVV